MRQVQLRYGPGQPADSACSLSPHLAFALARQLLNSCMQYEGNLERRSVLSVHFTVTITGSSG